MPERYYVDSLAVEVHSDRRSLGAAAAHCAAEAIGHESVKTALEGPVVEACPASVLRRHSGAHLFLDADSAALLTRVRRQKT